MPTDISALWRDYARTGPGDDSPVYRDIAHSVASDQDLLDVVLASPPDTRHPNHLFAAVRFLLLGGVDHPLADSYADGDRVSAVGAFREFVLDNRRAILDVLKYRRVQTNEIGRLAVIVPALVRVRGHVDQPLALLDVGSSAGFNQLGDRVHIDYGSFATGSPESPVHLECEIGNSLEPYETGVADIAWRLGLDRSPIDLSDDESARWLLACVWADQPDRIERLAAAIELARSASVNVMAGDAVEDLNSAIAQVPTDLHLVVVTSWVLFYLDRTQRRAFADKLAAAGRPVSWVSFEHPGVVGHLKVPRLRVGDQVAPSVLGHVTWAGSGGDTPVAEVLGHAHPHGRWMQWAPTLAG